MFLFCLLLLGAHGADFSSSSLGSQWVALLGGVQRESKKKAKDLHILLGYLSFEMCFPVLIFFFWRWWGGGNIYTQPLFVA